MFEVLDNSSYIVVGIPDDDVADTASPAAPAEGGDDSGGASGGGAPAADSFDADAIVQGTVDEVKAKLAELTPEQRAAVVAAEQDREVPRKGVLDALAALTPPAE